MRTRLSLAAYSDDPEVIARVAEQFARTAAGLGLDGTECFISVGPEDES